MWYFDVYFEDYFEVGILTCLLRCVIFIEKLNKGVEV